MCMSSNYSALLPQMCGRTIRVDHVSQYRRPKDEHGNEIIEKGCAPKTPTPSPSPSPSPSPVHYKKEKKKKGKKKHKKHQKEYFESSGKAKRRKID